jgi:hypothetical protein
MSPSGDEAPLIHIALTDTKLCRLGTARVFRFLSWPNMFKV